MILRSHHETLLAITQPDHAALAAELIDACRPLDGHPRRDSILFAAREHDNGWQEEDASGHIDAATGAPLDFVHVPDAVKHRIWPRAVARVGATRPYEAALIAQHALTVHGHMRDDAAWRSFFGEVRALRDEMLERGGGHDTLEHDYIYVQTADRLSLIFCNAWSETFELPLGGTTRLIDAGPERAGLRLSGDHAGPEKGGPRLSGDHARLERAGLRPPGDRAALEHAGVRQSAGAHVPDTLEISASAFAGVRLPFAIRARRLDSRGYASLTEFRAALDGAPTVVVSGTAVGIG